MITVDEVRNMLLTNPKAVTRALIVLNERQTYDEQSSETTKHHNNRGFRPCHAKMGTSMAKFAIKAGFLTPKQVAYWWRKEASGKARIEIYATQLHKVALAKAATSNMLKQLALDIDAPVVGNDDIPDPVDPKTDAEFNNKWAEHKNEYARREARQEQASFNWQMDNN
jgi:hypothetical protein